MWTLTPSALVVALPLLVACHTEASGATGSAEAPARTGTSQPPPPSPCPEEMAVVEGFCIDRWEAHLVRDAGEHSSFDRPTAGAIHRARSASGVPPQGYVSRTEAAAACEAAGKRLCRAREWYRACAGAGRTVYPWGDEAADGRCNVGKPHLMQKLFGSVHFTYDAHYNSPKLNQAPGFLAPTGAHAGCVTADGVFDMVGNLHEWVADDVSGRLAEEIPIEAGANMLGSEGSGVFMGGYFSSRGEHGRGCAYVTATHSPDYHDYSTGFRCCRDL